MTALSIVQNNYKSSSLIAQETCGLHYAGTLDCDCVDDDCGQHGGEDCNDCS